MKRSRNSSAGFSPKGNKKKVRNESPTSAVMLPSENKSTPTNCSRTSGGISRNLLTPCRRMGLTRNRAKPLNVFSSNDSGIIDVNISSAESEREKTGDFEVADLKLSNLSSKDAKLKKSASKNSVKKSNSKENTLKNEDIKSQNVSVTPPVIDIFVRESKLSQDSITSSDVESVIENVDINNIKESKNIKESSKSPKAVSNNKSSKDLRRSKSSNKIEDIVSDTNSKENQNNLPKVILHKIKSPDANNSWKVSTVEKNSNENSTRDLNKTVSNHVDQKHSDTSVKTTEHVTNNGVHSINNNKIISKNDSKKSKNSENTSTAEKVSSKSKLATKKEDVMNGESFNKSIKDKSHSKTEVVGLKTKSSTCKEDDLFRSGESQKDDRKCNSLGNTPKKSCTKDNKKIRKNDEERIDMSMNVVESGGNNAITTDKKKSDSELLKSKNKNKDDRKKSKSTTDVVLNKADSKPVSLSSTTSSQSSMYSYQSDDDFEDKTIIEKKTYCKLATKKSKLKLSGSNTSLNKVITQKDIDEIKERISQKEEKLRMINESPRKGLTEAELEELVVAWRGGCQKALEELLQVSKARGTMKSDADMEDLLRALHIPHDLVKYDPDEMIFE